MKTILYCNSIDYNFPLQQRPHHIMNLLAKTGKYKVCIKVDRKSIFLGCFEDITEAIEAYSEASNKYHKDFSTTR